METNYNQFIHAISIRLRRASSLLSSEPTGSFAVEDDHWVKRSCTAELLNNVIFIIID